ncbi:2OG-Fe(II) oxygenase superfamily-domain-containing protein, partial [Phellopilus nigrolimitatus]
LNYECPKIPLPDGVRPRIWAASRQAICETSSWFRSYHGGVYQNKENVYGYLLGGFSSQRDKFLHEGRFIISHGGGKSLEDSLDQRDNDRSVRALLRNYENRSPIVLIADDKYVLFPYDLGKYMYVVLGLYWITDAWAEKEVFLNQGNYEIRVKYKFSFQYCEGQGCPWWLADGRSSTASSVGSSDVNTIADDSLDVRDDSSSNVTEITCANTSDAVVGVSFVFLSELPTKIRCEFCGQSSPSVYREGWMCLRPSCTSFFQANSKEHFTLNYNDHFLELRPHPNFGRINLIPQSPIKSLNAPPKDRYSPRGWWCPDCGQLCCRERWECWDCSDCKVLFKDIVQLPIRTHEEFWDQELKLGSFRCYKIRRGSGISFSASVWTEPDSNKVGPLLTFEFPEKRGRIHIIAGHRLVNHRANELFKLYQQEALSKPFLRRYPLRNVPRGRMLANYFSQNSGAPYKYVVGTNNTVPFDQAPEAVGKALQLIKDRASLVVGLQADFNEILTAAYMEEQKMAYHSDSEKGLGPVVSSLSLGSIALMHFRLNKAQKEGPREKQLTLVLRHGDICVMEGAQIQDLYDHTVEPMNFRIAATARYIAPSY